MIFIGLSIFYIVISIHKKEDKSNIRLQCLLALLICLIASAVGLYPIQDRLVQSFTIMLLILSAFAANEIENECITNASSMIKRKRFIFIVFSVILLFCFTKIGLRGSKNFFGEHVYVYNSEVAANMEYLNKNLKDGDMVYVMSCATPVYFYETNYAITANEVTRLSKPGNPCVIGNTICGQDLFYYLNRKPYSYAMGINFKAIEKDSEVIANYDTVYIFTTHEVTPIPPLLEALEKKGTTELVSNTMNAYLYKFTKD